MYHYEPITNINGETVYIIYPIKVIYKYKSRYQEIQIVDTPFGKGLILDDVLQFTTNDEEIYHVGLVHPVINKKYRNILILGGGDGGAAREIKKVLPKAEVDVVDIDPMVTEIVEKFIPEVPAGIFNNPDVNLIHKDAYEYVNITNKKYDLILGDLTDIREDIFKGSQVNKLYTHKFLMMLKKILRPKGKVVYHIGGLNMDTNFIGYFWNIANSAFNFTIGYGIYIPSFFDIWCYIVMSDHPIKLGKIKYRYIKLNYCNSNHVHTPTCFIK